MPEKPFLKTEYLSVHYSIRESPIVAEKLRRATLKSIASDLGVTHTTVSNAYNNPAKLSKKVRDEILRYADSVGFLGPDPTARSLRTGRRGAIGVVFNDQLSYAFTDRHDIAFLRGVSSVCEKTGENIVLIPAHSERASNISALSAMVDGYILNAPYESKFTTRLALSGSLPAVVVDYEDLSRTSVCLNDADAMEQVGEHILSLGHRDIGIITFPLVQGRGDTLRLDVAARQKGNYVASQRLRGCRNAIRKRKLDIKNVIVQEAVNSGVGGASAMRSLLKENPKITAVICLSDRLAYGAMAACKELEMDVPRDMSITGFDDIDEETEPRHGLGLTTVRQDAYEKGRVAAEALLSPSNESSRQIKINATLTMRNSTAKPREE
jgi:DNA-binding LacI/PurR family transcriptional regulator